MVNRTLVKCKLCGEKVSGRIEMFNHLRDEHTEHERLVALMENVDPGPRYSRN